MQALSSLGIEPFVIDIADTAENLPEFLQSKILIINITCKDIAAFGRLIKAIEKSAVEQVLFVSSTSVYEAANRVISESDGLESPQHPLVMIENQFLQNDCFESSVVRFGGLVGYSRHPGRFFRGGRTVKDPDSNVNLIHRDDCINILEKIVASGTWGETFNCCADTHPSKREFYSRATRQLGLPPPVFDESGDQPCKIISNAKVKRMLEYEFLYPDLMQIDFGESA